MKKFIYSMSALFVVALAVIVGLRMSADAMAVIIGIICGMLATIPTTILLIFTLRQKDQQRMQQQYQNPNQHYPPVVVVNGQPNTSYPTMPPNGGGQGFLPAPDSGRAFKVVGQDSTPAQSVSDGFSISSLWDDA